MGVSPITANSYGKVPRELADQRFGELLKLLVVSRLHLMVLEYCMASVMRSFLSAKSSKHNKSACYSLGFSNCYLLPRVPCGFACEGKECLWAAGFISYQAVLHL